MSDKINNALPDKKLAAVCGLFCLSCGSYIGSTEEPKRLELLAQKMGKLVEDIECLGCRSDKQGFFCKNFCKMKPCAAEKGIDFCGECDEYPCDVIKDFQKMMPHRIELWKSLERIREAGYEKWYEEMVEHYSCSECGTINSAYDIKCRKCGATPGSDYIREHKDEVAAFLSKK